MSKKNKQDETQTPDTQKLELIADLQRLQAEFENYKKRTARELEIFRTHASEGLIKELLPVLDNFAITLANNKEESEFSKGIELTYAQLIEVLQGQGVEKIEALGKKFDPKEHEALMTKESKEDANTVLEVMQEGYRMNDKVIRHAKVIVSK